jgi:hypothetical protein
MGNLFVIAARTLNDLEAQARSAACRLAGFFFYDLHRLPHDTQPQAARQVYASTTPARLGQAKHRFQMRP